MSSPATAELLERVIMFDSLTARVRAIRDVSPGLRRITFTGPRVADMVVAGPDQRIKLFLPPPGGGPWVPPGGADWYADWLATPEEQRVIMRTYTVRALRPEQAELDIDFAMHGRLGPAANWSYDVAVGNEVAFLVPYSVDTTSTKGLLMSGVDYVPPATSRSRLLVADETALPALEGILEQLPPEVHATAYVEVAGTEDIRPLSCSGKADVNWVVKPDTVLDAVRSAVLPADLDYAWVAGESAMIKHVRRHLVAEGLPKPSISFQGYWKRGQAQC